MPRVEDVEGSLVVRRWQRSDVAASGAVVLLGVTRPRAVGTGTSHGDGRNGPISDVVVGRRRRRRPRRRRRRRWRRRRGRRRRLLQLHVASASTISSMGQRVARDGRACDLFDFVDWYRPEALALQRWREAPPLAEVQDEREIALEGMLTRRSSPAPAAASGAPPEPDEDTVPIDPNLQRFLEAEESIHGMMPDPDDDGSDVEGVGGDDTQRDERYYENLRNSMRFSEA